MRFLIVITALIVFAAPAQSEIRFSEWTAETLPGLVENAGDKGQTMMVVVTQPDWCPPCIRLDREVLGNPSEHTLRDLSRDWVILEIFGYDKAGADLLAAHKLKFHGTPTTFLMNPRKGDEQLGDVPIATSIVGFPDDYLVQIEDAVKGFDPLAVAQKRVRSESDLASWQELAEVYVSRGDVDQARLAYQSILMRDDLSDEERRDTEWNSIISITQRVEKDHDNALALIQDFGTRHAEFAESEDYAFASAWSLMALGHNDKARQILDATFIEPETVDGLATVLYIVFRNPSEGLLDYAEKLARDGLEAYPDSTARLNAGLGRILRRQGRLAEAEAAFARAVDLTPEDDGAYAVYAGQLQFVREQLAASDPNSRTSLK